MLVDLRKLDYQCLRLILRPRQTAIPQIFKHRTCHLEQTFGRLERLQEGREIAFDLLFANGLAIAIAAAFGTKVIRIAIVRPRGPAGRERRSAAVTDDKAPQRKIFVQIFPHRRAMAAVQPFLNLLERLVIDEPLMLSAPERHIPVGGFDMTRVNALCENAVDPLNGDCACPRFREARMRLQEAGNIGVRFKTPRGIAFQRFLDHRRERLIARQHHAAPRNAPVFESSRCWEDAIAAQHTRAHAVDGLLAVLLSMMLRDAGQEVLDKDGIRILAKLDGGRFQNATRFRDHAAQFQMRLQSACEARHIVNNNNRARWCRRPTFLDKGEHRFHNRPVSQTARHVVTKDLNDIVSFHAREFAAARFL